MSLSIFVSQLRITAIHKIWVANDLSNWKATMLRRNLVKVENSNIFYFCFSMTFPLILRTCVRFAYMHIGGLKTPFRISRRGIFLDILRIIFWEKWRRFERFRTKWEINTPVAKLFKDTYFEWHAVRFVCWSFLSSSIIVIIQF